MLLLYSVERGLIGLDEQVDVHLPELANSKVLSRNDGPDASTHPFILQPSTKKITLRHLLAHSSGIGHESNPLVREWRASDGQEPKTDYHPTVAHQAQEFSTTLLFEPGEGWLYGANIGWTSVPAPRLTNQRLDEFVQEHIFNPLDMKSSTYQPQNHPDICPKALQMVIRDGDRLLPAKYPLRELMTSVTDLASLLADLISPSSKLLNAEHQDLLFAPQFAPSSAALSYIRRDTENYATPAGIPDSIKEAPVNHSLATLVVEEQLPCRICPRVW